MDWKGATNLTVRPEGMTPSYSQPDRKMYILVFDDFPYVISYESLLPVRLWDSHFEPGGQVTEVISSEVRLE